MLLKTRVLRTGRMEMNCIMKAFVNYLHHHVVPNVRHYSLFGTCKGIDTLDINRSFVFGLQHQSINVQTYMYLWETKLVCRCNSYYLRIFVIIIALCGIMIFMIIIHVSTCHILLRS